MMKKKSTKKAKSKAKKKPAPKKSVVKKTSNFGLIPLRDRVLVKPILADEGNKTASGIIIPDTIDKERPERGRVVAVGGGKYEEGRLIPVSVKVGDVVVFSKYGFDEVKLGEEEYYLIKDDNILAIVK